jgi:hypothetical protein
MKEWYSRNRSKMLEKGKKYRTEHGDQVSQTKKNWYKKNKEHRSNRGKLYYKKNQDAIKKKSSDYFKANRELQILKRRRHYSDNKPAYKAANTRWRRSNLARYNFLAAKHRKAVKRATPEWLTDAHWQEIDDIYHLAKEMAWLNEGTPFHVDHIVPLQGEVVCGLHVPWNLQLLSPTNNMRKNNKF